MRSAASAARRIQTGTLPARSVPAQFPLWAWEVWARPAAVVIALSFLHLAAVFTAYRCLAKEQALRQALARQGRLVASLSAEVTRAEQQVLRAVEQSGMPPVPDRALVVTVPADDDSAASAAEAASLAMLPCRSWPKTEAGCPQSAARPGAARPSSAGAHQR